MGKWADLPVELVEVIEDCIDVYSDKVRFRALCWYWHQQLPKIELDTPCLLLAVDDDNVEASLAIFNPSDQKYYYLDVPNVLQGKIWKGSSHGWVITVEDAARYGNGFKKDCNRICLINPITNACIELPSRDKFPDVKEYNLYQLDKEYSCFLDEGDWSDPIPNSSRAMAEVFTDKLVMSSDPSRSNNKECVIATTYEPLARVACCALKNKRWNTLFSRFAEKNERFYDITFHKGKLYALMEDGRLRRKVSVFENINRVKPNPSVKVIARYKRNPCIECNLPISVTVSEDYLVERSDGSCVMLVERIVRAVPRKDRDIEGTARFEGLQTLYFKVYEIDEINRSLVELKSIGEDAIILGMNAPFTISSRNSLGYKGNHIYYTDLRLNYNRIIYKLENNDIGVFSLEDGTLQPLCGLKSSSKVLWPPPIWISPWVRN